MRDPDVGWLRDHMQDYLNRADSTESMGKVLGFERPTRLMGDHEASSALALVHQAAEVITGIEHRASETEARAQSLVKSAIQKLELAEARIRSAENERRTAIHEAGIRLDEAMNALKEAETRITAAESRANTAEARLSESERALTRIEEAIRTQLVDRRRVAHKGSMAA